MVTNVTIWMLGMKGGDFHFQIKMVTGLKQFQMVTCSNGDKFNLKWIVSFISNGDTIKWWHFWFDKNKRIYFKWWHDQMVTYLVWNEMENNNRFFIPLAVWIQYSLIFLHNTCQVCYRLLKRVTMKIHYHKRPEQQTPAWRPKRIQPLPLREKVRY